MRGAHWIARVFMSAFARRVAYVLVAVVLASLGIGRAHAASGQCTKSDYKCDQGQAMSACQAYDPLPEHIGIVSVSRRQCFVVQESSSQAYYGLSYWGKQSNGSEVGAFRAGNWYYGKSCSSRSDYNGAFPSVYGAPRNGSVQCFSGCNAAWYANGDGTFNMKYTSVPGACDGLDTDAKCKALLGSSYYYNGALGVCEPKEADKCPAGQEKDAKGNCEDAKCPEGMTLQQDGTCKASENECPAGNIKSPSGQCLPGEGQCATGEALGKDGTCKRDSNGDGTPDEDEGEGEDDPNKDSASGGDDCNAPPSCSGNPISCMQVKIQWRIDCNTRRNVNINGGSCSAAPVCTGEGCNAMEYAQLLQQWRSACALEKLADKGIEGGSDSTGDANKNGVPDVLEGQGTPNDPGDGKSDVDKSKRFRIGVSTDMLDTENIFGGGTCPQPPTFQLAGVTISGADFPYFCQAAAILRALIWIFGAYTAIKILMGWGF